MSQEYNGWTNYETWNVAFGWTMTSKAMHLQELVRITKNINSLILLTTRNTTPDGVSLFDPKLNHKELDDKIKELGA